MASKDYKIASKEKLACNAAKIPQEWRLSPELMLGINATSELNVLDVPRTCGILSAKELDITENYDATALLEHIASRTFSSHEVVLAFCKRAAIAQQLVRRDWHNQRAWSLTKPSSIVLLRLCLKML